MFSCVDLPATELGKPGNVCRPFLSAADISGLFVRLSVILINMLTGYWKCSFK